MSSYSSTITINDNEWRAIQNSVSDTQIYVARQKEKAEQFRREAQRREQELVKLREQTKQVVNSAVTMIQGEFNRALGDIASASHDALSHQSLDFEKNISQLRDELNLENARTKKVSSQIEMLAKEYADMISAMGSAEHDTQKRVKIFSDNISSTYDQITTLNPEVFAPGRFQQLQQMMAELKANVETGSDQAALMVSQNGVLAASRILVELIVANESYDQTLGEILAKANTVRNDFERLSPEADGLISFDIGESKQEYKYDINHWSDGKYAELYDEFQTVYQRIVDAMDKKIPLGELETLGSMVEKYELSLKQCDEYARKELLGSLETVMMSTRLCKSLARKNWVLQSFGFENKDNRNPYSMVYKDGAGNDISIVVSPGATAEKPNIFLEAFADDESRADIAKEDVHAALSEEGILIEQTQRHNDCSEHRDSSEFIQNILPKANMINKSRKEKSFSKL